MMENYKLVATHEATNRKIEYRIRRDNASIIRVYYVVGTTVPMEIVFGMLKKETKRGYTIETWLFTHSKITIFLPRQDFIKEILE